MNFKEYKEKINKESYPDDYFFLKYDSKTGKTYKDEEMYNIKKRFSDILHDELKSYKNIIGNKYYRQIIYLSKKDYEKVELGKPYNLTAYVSKKKNKIPNALFLTKKQIKDLVMAEYEDGYFNLTLSKDQIEKTLKETQNINVKISNILDKLSNAKSNLEFRREKNLKKFIADLMKYSSKTPMLKSREQQDKKVIKSYLDKNKKNWKLL